MSNQLFFHARARAAMATAANPKGVIRIPSASIKIGITVYATIPNAVLKAGNNVADTKEIAPARAPPAPKAPATVPTAETTAPIAIKRGPITAITAKNATTPF